jgi:transaldolase
MNLKKDINFSLWCDFIERDFLEDGFKELLEKKLIHGATSNPAIFQNAIVTSSAYEQQINMLQANEAKKIYEELAITDIKRAAQLLKPLHDENDEDGFISLEVDPTLCDDTFGTFEEGTRLYNQINHDNIMIKVPATQGGYPAMKYLTSLGIPVNATLVFSPTQAIRCAEALNAGIEESGKDTKAVISIFVSRFDRLLDNKLIAVGLEESKLGINNATLCYHEIEKFKNKNIRTLFASTGVKGDTLSPSYYIDNLIFPNTINTAPLEAIKAWELDGKVEEASILSEDDCKKYFKELEDKGIDINSAYNTLLKDGLSAFKVSFEELLNKVKL